MFRCSLHSVTRWFICWCWSSSVVLTALLSLNASGDPHSLGRSPSPRADRASHPDRKFSEGLGSTGPCTSSLPVCSNNNSNASSGGAVVEALRARVKELEEERRSGRCACRVCHVSVLCPGILLWLFLFYFFFLLCLRYRLLHFFLISSSLYLIFTWSLPLFCIIFPLSPFVSIPFFWLILTTRTLFSESSWCENFLFHVFPSSCNHYYFLVQFPFLVKCADIFLWGETSSQPVPLLPTTFPTDREPLSGRVREAAGVGVLLARPLRAVLAPRPGKALALLGRRS